jgi:hypothetical protein
MSVESLISAAQGYTSNLVGQASTAMTNATGAAMQVGYTSPEYNPVGLPVNPPDSIDTTLPDFADITFEVPQEPNSAFAFQDISSINVGGLPEFLESTPTLDLPTKPSQVAQFHGVSPSIKTDFDFPEPPDLLLNPLIETPTISSYETPEKPQVMLPAFGSIAPALDAVAPGNLEQTLANTYASVAPSFVTAMDGYVDAMLQKHNPQYHVQMAAIESQLTKYLSGGTGLNSSVENAIYERARSKNNAEAKRVQDGAWGDAAARGFTLPNGALMASMQTARQAAADNNAAAAREIVVMQAEMEQKNLQFAVTTSAGLRTALLNASLSYHQNLVSINGQSLEYAKTALNAVIETYNTAVKAFSAKLDAYKADAQVFEVKLRGAMAGIELYKAEIDAMQALVSVDKAKVDIYRARIDSLTSLAGVYRAQIEAVQGRAGLEKLKLDLFQSQVQSYTSLVQAKNSEWQGYVAAVNGQDAKVKIYSAQIDGYRGQIDGYRAKIDAQAEAVRATAMTNQARADQYKAILSGYQTVTQVRGDVARTKIQIQGQLLDAFKAKVRADIGNAQVKQAYYQTTSNVAIENATSELKAKIAEGANRTAWGDTLARAATANAQIYAGLASSAMAGMNTLAAQTQSL